MTYAHGVAEPSLEANIEIVRGQLSDDRAQQVLDFWARQCALQGAAAHERLREVVCLALGADGEIVGVNSVFPHNLGLIGGRPFWVYRSCLAPDAGSMAPEMINSAFATLEGEFNQKSEGPIGLCVLVADRAEMERHPETLWPRKTTFSPSGEVRG